MNDTPALPTPEPVAEPAPIPNPGRAAPPAGRRISPAPVLTLLGFVILAAAVIWLWRNPAMPAVDPAQITSLQRQVLTLEQRLAQIEQRPLPAALDLHPLEARIAALEKRTGPDLAPIETRIAALEQRPQISGDVASKADLAALASHLDAAMGRLDQLASRQQGLETGLGNKLDTLETRVGSLEHEAAGLAGLAGRVDGIDKRLGAVEHQAGQVAALADKAGRIGRLQAAQTALDSGQPLGDLPGAPASLTRFAQARPPTDATLRLSFPAAAVAAEAASRPSAAGEPFLDRMWTRAQSLVTLREGDRVVLGDPAAGIIARARRALLAGDLAGAVAALDGLSGPAAQAMTGWKAEAQSLLDARAALAAMAAHA